MNGSPSRLRARALYAGYDARPVLAGVDFDVPDRAVTVVIGPNGCGKSTLLRALGRVLRPRSGDVSLDGTPIDRIPPRELAARIGMLPQTPIAPEGITVTDLVARARQPHQSWLRQWSRADDHAVRTALRRAGIADLAHRSLDELSGGQRQRAWIAFVLAQETDILLLDEPTTFLDLAHAVDVLDLVDVLHRDMARTIVMVMHDLNLAIQYADHLVVMKDGAIRATGPPHEVVTADLLAAVFGLDAAVVVNPAGEGVLVVPRRRGTREGRP